MKKGDHIRPITCLRPGPPCCDPAEEDRLQYSEHRLHQLDVPDEIWTRRDERDQENRIEWRTQSVRRAWIIVAASCQETTCVGVVFGTVPTEERRLSIDGETKRHAHQPTEDEQPQVPTSPGPTA